MPTLEESPAALSQHVEFLGGVVLIPEAEVDLCPQPAIVQEMGVSPHLTSAAEQHLEGTKDADRGGETICCAAV